MCIDVSDFCNYLTSDIQWILTYTTALALHNYAIQSLETLLVYVTSLMHRRHDTQNTLFTDIKSDGTSQVNS
jgi:hypothetical protein